MTCEYCRSEHSGGYASGRFCEEPCYRKFCSERANRRQELKWKIIRKAYEENPNRCLECKIDLPYEKRKQKYCGKSCSGKFANRGKFWSSKKCRHCGVRPQVGVLCDRCREKHWDENPYNVLIDDGSRKPPRWALLKIREYRCEGEGCLIIDKWNGQKIVLHFDHINGKKTDHRPQNVRWLCPNCHSQTPTYAGKNIKNPIRVSSTVERGTLNADAGGSNPSP